MLVILYFCALFKLKLNEVFFVQLPYNGNELLIIN